MKKSLILISIIAVICCMTSCYPATPILDGETPFVVREIRTFNDSMAVYVGDDMAGIMCGFGPGYDPELIAPLGKYNLKDTITLY